MVISKCKEGIKKILPRKVIVNIRLLMDYFMSNISSVFQKKKYDKLSATKIDEACIKVGFLVQMPELWDKQAPLFEALVNDNRFKPIIILIPAYDFIKKTVGVNYDDNFFLTNYPDYCIRAYENNKWVKIKNMNLDYLFYQRPYDWYLPKEFQSMAVSSHTRCCYIPYAFWPLKHDLCGYNRSFFRSLYFGFLESKENCQEIIRLGDYEAEKRYLYCGYPSLVHEDNASSHTPNDVTTILWTPRWNYDDNIGGSHFFEYKDDILTLMNEFHGINLVLRPHPLSFQNYVSLGKMTEDEVDDYKRRVIESGASFDKNKLINETFLDVDILITDISSILYSYILYEKPIIFCNTTVPKSPSFESLMECMYIAESWDEIIYWIREIMNGNDELKDKRHCFAERMKLENRGAVDNIIGHLIEGK